MKRRSLVYRFAGGLGLPIKDFGVSDESPDFSSSIVRLSSTEEITVEEMIAQLAARPRKYRPAGLVIQPYGRSASHAESVIGSLERHAGELESLHGIFLGPMIWRTERR